MISKIGLASLLWAPRAFNFEDLLDNIYNTNENVYISQFFTMVIVFSGFFITLYTLKRFISDFNKAKSYVYLYILFYILAVLNVFRSETPLNLEVLSTTLTPIVVYSMVTNGFNLEKIFRLTFTLILSAGLIAAVVNPEWAYVLDYESDLALFDKRFAGVLSHPNVTGVVSITCLILALAHRDKYFYISIFVSLASLILSQSKTNWIASFFIFLLFIFRRFLTEKYLKFIFCIIAVPAVFFPFFYLGIYESLPADPIYTLTGRVSIWQEAVNYYLSSPLIGFGGEAWGVAFREQSELTGANHAHNQILETMSTQGTLGLVVIFTIFSKLFHNVGKKFQEETGFIFSSVLFYIVLRGISEPSISHHNVTVVLFTMMIVSFSYLKISLSPIHAK
jgi:O-antigen ligase